tara:strand:+ start:407 stop:658 length:252 start_codon:yes stop_codon:yes gene_type:complete
MEKETRLLAALKRKLIRAVEKEEEARKNRYPIDDALLAMEPPPNRPLDPRPSPEGSGLICYPSQQTGIVGPLRMSAWQVYFQT